MIDHTRYTAMRKALGLTHKDVAEITGNTHNSTRSATQKGRPLPRNLKLAVWVYEYFTDLISKKYRPYVFTADDIYGQPFKPILYDEKMMDESLKKLRKEDPLSFNAEIDKRKKDLNLDFSKGKIVYKPKKDKE